MRFALCFAVMSAVLLILFVSAAAITAVSMPFARKAGLQCGLGDKPGGRKKHDDIVPLVGGLVIFPVFMVLAALYGVDWSIYAYFFML